MPYAIPVRKRKHTLTLLYVEMLCDVFVVSRLAKLFAEWFCFFHTFVCVFIFVLFICSLHRSVLFLVFQWFQMLKMYFYHNLWFRARCDTKIGNTHLMILSLLSVL